jgi:hypothetical protein
VSVSVATIIDQSKLHADKRGDGSITDADWLIWVNWSIEAFWRLVTKLDPELYFSTVDFSLGAGAALSFINFAGYPFTVRLASASPLPSCIPSGAGVGATLTAAANGALSVDGTAVVANDRILIRAGHVFVADAYNGIWRVQQAGSGGTPFILVRATDYDQFTPLEVQVGARIHVTAGSALSNTDWYLSALAGQLDVVSGMVQTYTQGNGLGFRSLHGLDLNPDTNGRRTIARRGFRERNQGVSYWTPSIIATDRRYDLRSFALYITPYESAAGLYRAYFRGAPYTFTSTSDTTPLDALIEQYWEYVPIRAAMKALGIEESDQGPLATALAAIVSDVTEHHTRDDGAPAVIADAEDDAWDNRWTP